MRGILRNPEYAGAYVYGRYSYEKYIDESGQIKTKIIERPMERWEVLIKEHHEGYISWDDLLEHRSTLANNQTNTKRCLLSGPAREGLALLQGLLICADCGRKIYIRYMGNGGIYPTYQCTWRKRDGISHRHCIDISCRLLDEAISKRVVEVLQPSQVEMAVRAFEELERRTATVDRQWQMKVDRAEYEAHLAQRRYEEVDPSNRLVASTLEARWNDALEQPEDIRKRYEENQKARGLSNIAHRKAEILSLGKDFVRLWQSKTTKPKDRKRMVRLLVKDITVKKRVGEKKVTMQIRWQGGANEEMTVDIPPNVADKWRHCPATIERVRQMAKTLNDTQIATRFNEEGLKSNKGNSYTAGSIAWIRYKHRISAPELKRPHEMSVKQIAEKFDVSAHVVYYWIDRKILQARKVNSGSPWWITLDNQTEQRLYRWADSSSRISKARRSRMLSEGGAL